ncbi:MAG: NAD(P)-dependent oxidoreductase, partial [Candidatus Ranarchaeia archaeon]
IVSHTASNLTATAEHCFALMLACAKKIPVADRYLRRNSWAYGYWSQEFSILLEGKTLAIIGLGAIGQALAKRALAFDMKVLGIRRSEKSFPGVTVYTMDQLSVVLSQADFVAVTLPLTKDTEGIIGTKEFNMMKKSAVFINTARGKIVDQEALYQALKNQVIACAGIDVWYKYPKHSNAYQREDNPPGEFPFHELDNLVMTPHRGGFVSEAEAIGIQQVVDNIFRFHEKKPVERMVNLDAGY